MEQITLYIVLVLDDKQSSNAITARTVNVDLLFDFFTARTVNVDLLFDLFTARTVNVDLLFDFFTARTVNVDLLFDLFTARTVNVDLLFDFFTFCFPPGHLCLFCCVLGRIVNMSLWLGIVVHNQCLKMLRTP